MRYMKRMLAALFVSVALMAVPMPALASSVQTETVQADAVPAETAQDGAVSAENAQSSEDEAVFMIIMLGGGLLVILTAVIASVATVSSAVAVAGNMDVDGE